jgi:hypothetical protein
MIGGMELDQKQYADQTEPILTPKALQLLYAVEGLVVS